MAAALHAQASHCGSLQRARELLNSVVCAQLLGWACVPPALPDGSQALGHQGSRCSVPTLINSWGWEGVPDTVSIQAGVGEAGFQTPGRKRRAFPSICSGVHFWSLDLVAATSHVLAQQVSCFGCWPVSDLRAFSRNSVTYWKLLWWLLPCCSQIKFHSIAAAYPCVLPYVPNGGYFLQNWAISTEQVAIVEVSVKK